MSESTPLDAEAARDLFSEAVEGARAEAARARFDAALAADAELLEEFATFEAIFGAPLEAPVADAPDLLPAVQKKLRERSRGRFYRDRFAEAGPSWPMWLSLVFVLLVAALSVAATSWIAMTPG